MIWKLEGDNAEQLTPLRSISTSIGMVSIHTQSNGEVLLETNDMAQMGLFREKFIREVLPQVRKILGMPQVDIKALKAAIKRSAIAKSDTEVPSERINLNYHSREENDPSRDENKPFEDGPDRGGEGSL
jgi:hypothetical protein